MRHGIDVFSSKEAQQRSISQTIIRTALPIELARMVNIQVITMKLSPLFDKLIRIILGSIALL